MIPQTGLISSSFLLDTIRCAQVISLNTPVFDQIQKGNGQCQDCDRARPEALLQ